MSSTQSLENLAPQQQKKWGRKDPDKKQARPQQSEVFRIRVEEDSGPRVKGSIGEQGQGSASAPVSPKLMGNLSTDIQALYLDPLFIGMIASSAQVTTTLEALKNLCFV